MTAKTTANSKKSTKPRGKPWPKGVSGNPAGAPKRGQSWADIIKEFGEMTPSEAAERSLVLAKQLMTIGDGVTLKQAVILRVYASLLFEPQPGLLNAFMERAEGKIQQDVNVTTWRDKVIDLIRAGTVTREDVVAEYGPDLSTELFIAAGAVVIEGGQAPAQSDQVPAPLPV